MLYCLCVIDSKCLQTLCPFIDFLLNLPVFRRLQRIQTMGMNETIQLISAITRPMCLPGSLPWIDGKKTESTCTCWKKYLLKIWPQIDLSRFPSIDSIVLKSLFPSIKNDRRRMVCFFYWRWKPSSSAGYQTLSKSSAWQIWFDNVTNWKSLKDSSVRAPLPNISRPTPCDIWRHHLKSALF